MHGCNECPATFEYANSLYQHFLQSSGVETEYLCPSCKETFPCSTTLTVHRQEHTLPNVKHLSANNSAHENSTTNNQLLSISYDCHICDQFFATRELLIQHSNIHLRGHTCQNDECQKLYGKSCTNNTNLSPDLNLGLKSTPSLNLNSNLNKPQTNVQIQSPIVPTKSKNFGFTIHIPKSSTSNIRIRSDCCNPKNYKKVDHTPQRRKRFQCKICGKLLSSKLSHDEHFRIHSGEKPYCCNICDKSYAVRNTFRQHMASHSVSQSVTELNLNGNTSGSNSNTRTKVYKCSICTQSFWSSEELEYHTCPSVSRRGESFRCKICGKMFARKEWRTKHYLSHGGESCFRCEICGDFFPDEQFYLIHAQIHFSLEIKKAFKDCRVCGKTFPGKDLYERHSCRFAAVSSG